MISKVTFAKTTYNVIPFKFEAGTPNYVGAIGMAEAIRYLEKTGRNELAKYENELSTYATEPYKTGGWIKDLRRGGQ